MRSALAERIVDAEPGVPAAAPPWRITDRSNEERDQRRTRGQRKRSRKAMADRVRDALRVLPMPAGSKAERAKAVLVRHVVEFMAAAAEHHAVQASRAEACGVPPAYMIRGTAGLGKTDVVLDAMKVVLDLLAAVEACDRNCMLMLVPTNDVAEDIRQRAVAKGIRALTMPGRGAPIDVRDPDGPKMCGLFGEEIDTIGRSNVGVTNTVCATCALAEHCAWLRRQREVQDAPGGTLFIVAHEHLTLKVAGLGETRLFAQVVDESFWQSTCRTQAVPALRFTDGGTREWRVPVRTPSESEEAFNERREAFADMRTRFLGLLARAGEWIDGPDRSVDRLRGLLTTDDCRWAAGIEESLVDRPRLDPTMSLADRAKAAKAFASAEGHRFRRVWLCLAVSLDSSLAALPNSLDLRISEDGTPLLHTFWSADVVRSATPTLMIDADAAPEIARRYFPQASYHVVDAPWRNTRVTQIIDRSLSMFSVGGSARNAASEANRKTQENNRERLAAIAEAMTMRAEQVRDRRLIVDAENGIDERILLVGYKAIEEDMVERADGLWNVAHAGALRGIDRYKHAAGLISVGRLQPPPGVVEDLRRSLFFASSVPLVPVKTVKGEDGKEERNYPVRKEAIRLRNGMTHKVATHYHPDHLADVILRQIREADIRQTLARVRPIHRSEENPCEVLIATNIPIHGIVIDRLVIWDACVPDRFEQMVSAGLVLHDQSDIASVFSRMFATRKEPQGSRKAVERAKMERAGALREGRVWAWACAGDRGRDQESWMVSSEVQTWWRITWTAMGPRGNRVRHEARICPRLVFPSFPNTPEGATAAFQALVPERLLASALDLKGEAP